MFYFDLHTLPAVLSENIKFSNLVIRSVLFRLNFINIILWNKFRIMRAHSESGPYLCRLKIVI